MKLLWAIPVAIRSDVVFQPDADAWRRKDHWRIADQFLYEQNADHFALLLAARRANIAIGVALVALIGWWAFRLWGRAAGLLACALAASDPNLAALAAILSMDLPLALFATAAGYTLWEYSAASNRWWFIATGVAIGLALASKYSAIVSVVGIVGGVAVYSLAGGWIAVPGALATSTLRGRLMSASGVFIRLGLVAVVVVVVAYFGVHALDWPRGLKQQLVRADFGDPHFFLDGEISSAGWLRYFPEVLAIKTPVGTLILLLLGLISFAVRRLDRREAAFVYLPALAYFAAMTIGASTWVGVSYCRHTRLSS